MQELFEVKKERRVGMCGSEIDRDIPVVDFSDFDAVFVQANQDTVLQGRLGKYGPMIGKDYIKMRIGANVKK